MIPKTTVELLDLLKLRHRLNSDYQLAKLLAIPTSQMSHYRAGRRAFDDAMALRVAQLLGVEAGLVLTWLHAERAARLGQPEVVRALERFARKAAACVLVAVGASGAPSPAQATTPAPGGAPAPSTQSLSIMSIRPRPRRRPIGSAFAQAVANLIRGPLACL